MLWKYRLFLISADWHDFQAADILQHLLCYTSQKKMSKIRRPPSITLLALFILGLSLWNGLRLVQAIAFWSILKEYQATPGPLYTATSGGFWFLVGLFIVWGLWQGKAWAWSSALGGTLGYGFWYWFDRLVFQEPHSNWHFALASTVILILFFIVLFSHSVIIFFFQRSPSALRPFQFRHNNKKIKPPNEN
jgi:hypothetical protein